MLRRLRPSDLAAFQAYRSIPELGQYQGWEPMSDDEAASFIARMSEAAYFVPGQWIQLGITDESGDLVGDVGIFLSEDGDTGEVGITLGPSSQGKGIATAAVSEALSLLFAQTQASRALGITDARNVASIRLLERIGFTRHESREAIFRGASCTEYVYIFRRIDAELVRDLVADQFPQWADLPVHPISPGGWDNKSFRLGLDWIARLPSHAAYVGQVDKEQRWLPRLAARLPVQVPEPVALGRPGRGYPWSWSIYRWIAGEGVTAESASGSIDLAGDIARFLIALHAVEVDGGPEPGAHNFFRGGRLDVYDGETRDAISRLRGRIDGTSATRAWEAAMASSWSKPPLWVHGDLSAGNLLVREGRLSAVIDFGNLAVGDAACDIAIAWSLFRGEARNHFLATLAVDPETRNRARGWVLWKALVVAAGISTTNAIEFRDPGKVIAEVLSFK